MRRACAGLVAGALAVLCAAGCGEKSPPGGSGGATGSSTPADAGAPAANANAADGIRTAYAALGQPLLDAAKDGKGADPLLAQHAADLDRLGEALKSSSCDFGVDYSKGMAAELPHIPQMRALARVLRADAARLAAAGDVDGSAKRTAAVLRLAVQVARPARTSIELLVAGAIAHLGLDFIGEHPELAKAAWKTDVQQALSSVGQGGTLNSTAIVKAEGELTVKSLREGKMMDMTGAGGRNWNTASQADRTAAADKLAAIYSDVAKAWDAPDAVSKLQELTKRASEEGVGDLVPPFEKLRESIDKVRSGVGAANTALRK